MNQEEELRVFKGRCGKVLLEYIQRLPRSKIKKMQNKLRNCGMKMEPQKLWKFEEKNHKENSAPIKYRNGYVYK